jgi:hypothetical protein
MIRKATLTNKTAQELRLKIDWALQAEVQRRLSRSAVDFLVSIQKQVTPLKVRLSKKQRDVTDEILAKAFSGESVVLLEGQSVADLIRYASGDGRISAFEEYFLLSLKPRVNEPAIALSGKQWRIVEEFIQKTGFGSLGGPPPLDPDGVVENEDPDGLPPERDETRIDWAIVGVEVGPQDWQRT